MSIHDSFFSQVSYEEAYKNIRAAQLAELKEYRESLEEPADESDWMREQRQRRQEVWAIHDRAEREKQVIRLCERGMCLTCSAGSGCSTGENRSQNAGCVTCKESQRRTHRCRV